MNKTYSKEQVFESTLKYFNGDSLATDIWMKKYALKDKDGNFLELNPDHMHKRIARELSRVEQKYPNPLFEKDIYNYLKNFKYIIPAGSNLFGIGNENYISSLSNCFYIHHNNYDSYGNILKLDEEMVHMFKRRAGVGVDVSFIRPKKSLINNAALSSTGIIPFMTRYSNTTQEVAQDGRRGALMITIRVSHPEIEEFIDSKLDDSKITGANISIKVTDDFMNAVKNDDYYELYFDLKDKRIIKKVKAKKIWNKFVHNSWKSAEPGILFWDKIKRESPSDGYDNFHLEGVNPCAELTLSDSESCRLLSVNLYSFVKNKFTKDSYFDFDEFHDVVSVAQRIMDDIVDLEIEKINKILNKLKKDPEPDEIKFREINLWKRVLDKTIKGRRTGLGVTGVGDMLAALNMQYATDTSNKFLESIFKDFGKVSYITSISLAKERGPFPIWNIEKDKKSEFIKRMLSIFSEQELKDYEKYGRRNIGNLTIAPNGSISLLTQTTSGIEPVFEIKYKRRRRANENEKETFTDKNGNKWIEYNVFHKGFLDYCDVNNIDINNKSDEEINEIIKKSPYNKSLSKEIDYVKKVEMQALINKWIDHSISVTINLPEDITEEKVSEIFFKGWEYGVKGLTIYRENSRTGVLVTNKEKTNNILKRPKELLCDIHHIQVNKIKYYVIVGLLNDKPYEIFAFKKKYISIPQLRKEGKLIKIDSGIYNLKYNGTEIENISQHFESPEEDAFTRMVSLLLRKDIPLIDIVNQINKSYSLISGFYKAISRVLSKNYLKDGTEIKDEVCPQCGGKIIMKDGCKSCSMCGWSKCS